jgi:hypothetical protein
MNVQQAIAKIRNALVQVQESGQQVVAIPPLLEFLRAVEQEAPLDSETKKLQHETNLAYYRVQHEHAIEMFRSVVESGKIALTTSILVNGGATVALLAFLGNMIGKSPPVLGPMQVTLVVSLMFFAGGVLAAAVATGSTYVTQYCYTEGWRRSATGFHVLTVALVVGAYLAFLGGMVAAYHAFVARGISLAS